MQLDNSARQRQLADAVASLSDRDRAKAVQGLVEIERALEQQQKFDAAVAVSLVRILMNALAETVRPLAKQLRKRFREIARG
jgi:hypothetical protein